MGVPTIQLSVSFRRGLHGLRDARAKARITARPRSASLGRFGDVEPVGDGICEMRIHVGPGYRLDDARRGEAVYPLLVGGDESSQSRDILRAKSKAKAKAKAKAASLDRTPS